LEINKVYNYDCIEGLRLMEDESVDCCVTSPPYWGLRDYGTAEWVGGNPDCPHKRETKKSDKTITGYKNFDDMMGVGDSIYKSVCPLCGAVRVDRQIGLEETPEQYVEKLVMIFREVKRVMKKEGTLWLNLGDSYWGGGWRGSCISEYSGDIQKNHKGTHCGDTMPNAKGNYKDIKNKDLVGIPWMVAFALRADGWYLRQDIIWSKPNPMPESVTDRCTKSHEYIFLLSKSQHYYFNAESIAEPVAEPVSESTTNRLEQNIELQNGSDRVPGKTNGNMKAVVPRYGGKKYTENPDIFNRTKSGNAYDYRPMRNKRDVWVVTTKPFKESHFATFPEELITPCILAGCPKEGVVLDPFMGAGTTALVALRNRRNYIGFELNPEYCELIERRLEQNRVGWGQLGISDIFSEEQ